MSFERGTGIRRCYKRAAETHDHTDSRISSTLFQQSLLLDTPDAYNVFTGGDVNDPHSPATPNPNPQSAIDPFLIAVDRKSETSLKLFDFKISQPALFELPAGDVGIGLGIEWREEEVTEDRDPRSDGTISFTDAITGNLVNVSDMLGSSRSPDARGQRSVTSMYAEFLVPLLSDAPLAKSLDLQLAGRYENFSGLGSVTKPRIAASWYPIDQLQFRAAYSEGFRAPNLVQIYQGATSVVNSYDDPARIDPVTGQPENYQVQEIRSGNQALQPEESENTSFGIVVTPVDGLTITLDYWEIEQEGVVGIFGGQNHIRLDSELRQQGSSNPAVQREVTTDGSVGVVDLVFDRYVNLTPRSIDGIDFSIQYSFDNSLGDFNLKLSGAKLTTFDQNVGPLAQVLVDAGIPASNVGSLIEDEFRPEWRSSLLATWRRDQWGAGLSANYVGEVFDPQTTADGDTADPGAPLPVDSYVTVNVHGDYRFEGGFAEETRLRIGIRNLFDEEPPLADELLGYEGSLHSWMGTYVYADLNIHF